MSLFLLSDHQLYPMGSQKSNYGQQQRSKPKRIDESELLVCHLESLIKKASSGPTLLKNESNDCIEYLYLSRMIKQRYYLIERLCVNKRKMTIELTLLFAATSGIIFTIQNMNSYVHNMSQFMVRPQKDQIRLPNVSIDLGNGLIIARLPTLYLFNHFLEITPAKLQNHLYKLFKYQIEQSVPLFEKILASNKHEKPYLAQSQEKELIWGNIYRYNEMINISSHLNESYLASEAQIQQNNKNKQSNIRKLIKNRRKIDDYLTRNSLLLQTQAFITNSIPQTERDFQLPHQEQTFAHYIIAIPNQNIRNAIDNNMILNYIHIKNDMDSLQVSKVNEGGFASLFFTQIKFQYVSSFEGEEEARGKIKSRKETNELKKFVMVKRSTTKQYQGRIRHEIQILKEIKNGAAIFLPKYYLAINKGCFFTNSIVMDYIAFKNLKEHLQSNFTTMSLTTKLFLSLRYLRDYRIVHLDLKSANIMIFFNLLIKLIDFGESYHPNVCQEKHTPGYTIPYSPPEVYFSEPTSFTFKSDVYSLGIIIFEILYNHLPFRSSTNTESDARIMEDCLERWYFMPEQLQARGQVKIMRLLNMLICKCLRPRQKDRPELDWIALIIRQCLDLVH